MFDTYEKLTTYQPQTRADLTSCYQRKRFDRNAANTNRTNRTILDTCIELVYRLIF